jgi:hypothetical protein
MLQSFSQDTFSGRVGQPFRLFIAEAQALELSLSQVQALGPQNAAARTDRPTRAPFSLVFLGPPSPVLPQRTYRFEHEQLGTFEIFIVPIGSDQAGTRYEAIFT